jgi:hypothetical protein
VEHPLILNPYLVFVMSVVFIYTIRALALNLLLGIVIVDSVKPFPDNPEIARTTSGWDARSPDCSGACLVQHGPISRQAGRSGAVAMNIDAEADAHHDLRPGAPPRGT